jgi:transglutaminase-like putative cysteine protease
VDSGASSDGGDDDEEDQGDGGAREEPPDLERASSGGGGDTPMAVLILDDDYSPPSQGYYLRQDAWSELNGTRLVRATRSDVDVDVPDTFPSSDARVPGLASITKGRETVHTFVALLVDHPRPFGLETPELLRPAKNPNPTRFKRAYRVVSRAQTAPYKELFGQRAGDPGWSPEVRAHYLAEPEDPRYAELARSIIAHAPKALQKDPFGQAVAVKLKLDESFKYSTKHNHAGAADPTADFLFGDQIGYCVHFAHAAVYLWRALGIPSRVGAGYRVDEDERHGGSSVLVRSRDAHGWIILDIAPKVNLDPPSPPVDTELQRMLGEMARSLPPDPADTSTGDPKLPSGLLRDVARGLLVAALAAILCLYAAKIWRRLAPRFAGAAALPWVGYRGALDLLSEVGAARRFGESREAFARRVQGLAPSFADLTRLHLRAALGARREETPVEPWRAGLAALRREIAAGVPRGRRVLGLVNPASFLRSK